MLLLLASVLSACQSTPDVRLSVSPQNVTQSQPGTHRVQLGLGQCRVRTRCELVLKIQNQGDVAIRLRGRAIRATLAGNDIAPVAPQTLLSEFQNEATESLAAQQFSNPPPRALNDQSLRQRQLAEAGRTAAARLEQQSRRMRYLKKITSQMVNDVTIAPQQPYSGYLVYDISAMQPGQSMLLSIPLAGEEYRFSLSALALANE